MAVQNTGPEKSFPDYADDKSTPTSSVYSPEDHLDKPQVTLRWFGKFSVLLTLIIGLLICAQVVEKVIQAGSHRVASPDLPLAIPAVPNAFLDEVPGVSIAASIDQNGIRQLFDLNSHGQIRVRIAAAGANTFGPKQLVSINPPPKKNSPLSAIAWAVSTTSTNVRLYYLDSNNRIVEAQSKCGIESCDTWSLGHHFTETSIAGISAAIAKTEPKVNIILYYLGSGSRIGVLSYNKGWNGTSTGAIAAVRSSLSSYFYPSTSESEMLIHTMYVEARGRLKEIWWYRSDVQATIKRVLDGKFVENFPSKTLFVGVPGSAYNPTRLYVVGFDGVYEREFNFPPTDAEWRLISLNGETDFPKPTNPTGTIAALSWGDKEVRVYYVVKGSLHEIGLTYHEDDGWSRGWYDVARID